MPRCSPTAYLYQRLFYRTAKESEARSAYEFLHDKEVLQVGLVTDDNKTFGCSPDGLVDTDGLAEFKVLKAENHIKALLYCKKHRKTPPDYIQQTQGQIYVCEREWCDLVFYHPDLPGLAIRQYRDADIIKALRVAIDIVCMERDKILSDIREIAN